MTRKHARRPGVSIQQARHMYQAERVHTIEVAKMSGLPKAIEKTPKTKTKSSPRLHLSLLRGPEDIPIITDGDSKVRFVPVGLKTKETHRYATVSCDGKDGRTGNYKALFTDDTWHPVVFAAHPNPLRASDNEKRASGQVYPVVPPRHPLHYNVHMATYCIDASGSVIRWGPMD